MKVGIEAINLYGGSALIQAKDIFEARGLDLSRFENLMMKNKAVNFSCEDAVTNGVNAAKKIVDALSEEERNSIEMLITASESGLDFGKSLSTYMPQWLGLSQRCRLFEIKQACYGGTAGLQMAVNFVRSQVSPGAKVLVIATDIARAAAWMMYAEPSQATGAAAMLIGENPKILDIDFGANGYHSYGILDSCRPNSKLELGNVDLSLQSYLECLGKSYEHYQEKVEDVDFLESFDYLCFHTPFAGMVKGAHRKMMRKFSQERDTQKVNDDFDRRMQPSLQYCSEIGNVYSASLYVAFCSLIDSAEFSEECRVGMFSYGSGCSSEFYSGLIPPEAQSLLAEMNIKENLTNRYALSMEEYDIQLEINQDWIFGVQNKTVDLEPFQQVYDHAFEGQNKLVLRAVEEFDRIYEWS